MKEIRLSTGEVAMVDDEDYPLLARHKWQMLAGYAACCMNYRQVLMHRMVFGRCKVGHEVDHIDRNKLNNQKSNLRHATRALNIMNRWRPSKWGRGVQRARNGKFVAKIKNGRKQTYLGTFATAQEARDAFDKAAMETRPTFFMLNRDYFQPKGDSDA